MRKPLAIRLREQALAQLVGGQWFGLVSWNAFVVMACLARGSGLLAAQPAAAATTTSVEPVRVATVSPVDPVKPAAGAPADPAKPATVTIEFLADGRCHVSAEGPGFRSNATYTPKAPAAAAGDLRCAMPPVPQGQAVSLTVVVPEGTPRPAGSEPALDWQSSDGRWSGTGRLTEWPDVVVVSAARPTWTFWGPVALAVLLGVVGLRRRRARLARAA